MGQRSYVTCMCIQAPSPSLSGCGGKSFFALSGKLCTRTHHAVEPVRAASHWAAAKVSITCALLAAAFFALVAGSVHLRPRETVYMSHAPGSCAQHKASASRRAAQMLDAYKACTLAPK